MPDKVRINRVGACSTGADEKEGVQQLYPNHLALTKTVRSLLESQFAPEDTYDYKDTALHSIAMLSPRFIYNALDNLDVMQEHQRAWFARLAPGVNNVGHMYFFRWWIICP